MSNQAGCVVMNIPMPESCVDCPCQRDYSACQLAKRSLADVSFDKGRPGWCPLRFAIGREVGIVEDDFIKRIMEKVEAYTKERIEEMRRAYE